MINSMKKTAALSMLMLLSIPVVAEQSNGAAAGQEAASVSNAPKAADNADNNEPKKDGETKSDDCSGCKDKKPATPSKDKKEDAQSVTARVYAVVSSVAVAAKSFPGKVKAFLNNWIVTPATNGINWLRGKPSAEQVAATLNVLKNKQALKNELGVEELPKGEKATNFIGKIKQGFAYLLSFVVSNKEAIQGSVVEAADSIQALLKTDSSEASSEAQLKKDYEESKSPALLKALNGVKESRANNDAKINSLAENTVSKLAYLSKQKEAAKATTVQDAIKPQAPAAA